MYTLKNRSILTCSTYNCITTGQLSSKGQRLHQQHNYNISRWSGKYAASTIITSLGNPHYQPSHCSSVRSVCLELEIICLAKNVFRVVLNQRAQWSSIDESGRLHSSFPARCLCIYFILYLGIRAWTEVLSLLSYSLIFHQQKLCISRKCSECMVMMMIFILSRPWKHVGIQIDV